MRSPVQDNRTVEQRRFDALNCRLICKPLSDCSFLDSLLEGKKEKEKERILHATVAVSKCKMPESQVVSASPASLHTLLRAQKLGKKECLILWYSQQFVQQSFQMFLEKTMCVVKELNHSTEDEN